MDKYLVVGRYPERGEDTLVTRQFQKAGGCPYNVARTLQNLGLDPVLYSAISSDEAGRELARTVEREGLNPSALYPLEGEPTGCCMIVLDGEGERTFFTFRGCEGHFDPARLPRPVAEKAAAVFVTGIYLLYPGWSERRWTSWRSWPPPARPSSSTPAPSWGRWTPPF